MIGREQPGGGQDVLLVDQGAGVLRWRPAAAHVGQDRVEDAPATAGAQHPAGTDDEAYVTQPRPAAGVPPVDPVTGVLPVDPTTVVPGAPLPAPLTQENTFTIPRTESGAEGCG